MLCNPDCWLSFERTRAYVDIWQLTSQGPHFTNGFSIAVQIQWIFHFTLTSVVSKWSLQTFQHDTTALLSWHVHKICCNLMTSNGITARRIFHRISIVGKKSLLKWAPECVVEIVLKLWILVIIYRTLPLSYEVQSFEAITLLKSRGVKFPMNVDRDRKFFFLIWAADGLTAGLKERFGRLTRGTMLYASQKNVNIHNPKTNLCTFFLCWWRMTC